MEAWNSTARCPSCARCASGQAITPTLPVPRSPSSPQVPRNNRAKHGVHVARTQHRRHPCVTVIPVKSCRTFTYGSRHRNAGSHMYHSHHNSTKQVGKGLLGAFIIEPKDKSKRSGLRSWSTRMILNDSARRLHAQRQGLPGHRSR